MQHDFILLDRSGSMSENGLWPEALRSVNAYVEKLAEENVDTGVTVATFDRDGNHFKFDVIRDRITPKTFKSISNDDAMPRGMTPLNDAIIKIVGLARNGNYEKVAIIMMTDGKENASREDPHGTVAHAQLAECRAKNWQVISLGADFDNVAQATSLGVRPESTAQVSKSNLVGAMRSTGASRAAYGVTGQSMDYSDEEKATFKQQ